MSLADIVNVNLTKNFVRISVAQLGIPLIVGEHSKFPERQRKYTEPDDMLADGFTSDDPEYIAASRLVEKNPRVKYFRVGRRTPGTAAVWPLTIDTVADDHKYDLVVDGVASEAVSFTSGTGATAADIQSGLIDAINKSGLPLTAAAGATDNDINVTSNYLPNKYALTTNSANLSVGAEDGSYAASAEDIDAALSAIRAENDDWLGIVLVSTVQADQEAASQWVESRFKLYSLRTNDPDAKDGTKTSDVFASLQALERAATFGTWDPIPWRFPDASALARIAVNPDVQATTWKFDTLPGIAPWDGSDTEFAAVEAKSANFYRERAGVGSYEEGVTFSGEFIDVTFCSYWFIARLQERVFVRLKGATTAGRKIPYTNSGISVLKNELRGQFNDAVKTQFIDGDSDIEVDAPKIADLTQNQRASRKVPSISGSGRIAGAIHAVDFNVTLEI